MIPAAALDIKHVWRRTVDDDAVLDDCDARLAASTECDLGSSVSVSA